MGERVWPVVLISALVVAAVLAVVPEDGDGDATRADPVAGFLAAYERSRTGTFAVEQRFTRTVPGRGELRYDRRLVQRPPADRLLVGGGSAEGRLDGRVVRCSTAPDGSSRCTEGPEADSYADDVAAEVAELRNLVAGESPVYDVLAGEPGCWALRLRLAVPAAPYGDLAGFCFDADTGAPLRLEIRRDEAVDVIEAVAIRTDVTAADLRPGDLGDLPTAE